MFFILTFLYLFEICKESHSTKLRKIIKLNKILKEYNQRKFERNGCLLVMGNKGLWIELIIKNPIMTEEQFEIMSMDTEGNIRKTMQGMMFESMAVIGDLDESTVIDRSKDEEIGIELQVNKR